MGGETGRSDSVSGNDGNGIVGEYTTLVKIVKDKPFLNGLRGWNPGKSPRSCGPQIRRRSAYLVLRRSDNSGSVWLVNLLIRPKRRADNWQSSQKLKNRIADS